MTGKPPGWETLNAYVDGELPPGERAEVAAALAARPDLARSVALLTKLKAAAVETLEPMEWDGIAPRGRSLWRRHRGWRVAAGFAIALCVGAAAVLLHSWRTQDDDAWLAPALAAHDTWVASGSPTLTGGGAGALLAGLANLGSGAELPDLTDAKLTITGARFVRAAGEQRPAMHVAYSGTRGCRVTLWITPASAGIGTALALHTEGPYRVYVWRAGDLAYALISSVNKARFEVIAGAAHKVTLERAQPDAETRTALRRSREQSPPCPA